MRFPGIPSFHASFLDPIAQKIIGLSQTEHDCQGNRVSGKKFLKIKKALPGFDGVSHPPPVIWIEFRLIHGIW
jgi:hypothetical protein